jgi:pyruvate dehydrogenase E2 component (dihydrolipoamide acetyltransferase)
VATEVTLPRLGQGMESGTIVRWLKAEGDTVARDEPLYELDTEKVTQEVESPAAGTVLRILVAEGTEVIVGQRIAWIGEPGEAVPEAETPGGNGAVGTATVPEAPAEESAAPAAAERPRRVSRKAEAVAAAEARAGERLKASPLARRMARERGIDLASVSGTGPEGRIVAEDVERAARTPAPAVAAAPLPAAVPAEESIPLTSVRKTIARRLSEAWAAPHFAITMSADMRRVIELRERLVGRTPEGAVRPTYSDVLTKLCALALLRHRDMNAHYLGDEVRRFAAAHVGIAVAIPNGLVVPVIRDADRRSIPDIAAARADLVSRTREGKLQQADLDGGTFTISNLGMYGVERFFAVLNPPQVGILAVGAIEQRVVAEGGQPVVRPRMEMTLSCDHRGVDGATASEFLRTLKELLEEPALAL